MRARPLPLAPSRSAAPDDPQAPCPCGTARPLAACCGPWLDGPHRLQAPDAEALMRSRYTAYVQGRVDYLLDTWHPSTRPADLALEARLRWLGLQVKSHAAAGDHATVHFVARSKLGGRAHRLQETSRFVREPGSPGEPARWFYIDGDLHEGGG